MKTIQPFSRTKYEGLTALASASAQPKTSGIDQLRIQSRNAGKQATSYAFIQLYSQILLGKDPDRLEVLYTTVLGSDMSTKIIQELLTRFGNQVPALRAVALADWGLRCSDLMEHANEEERIAAVLYATKLLNLTKDIKKTMHLREILSNYDPSLKEDCDHQIRALWTAEHVAGMIGDIDHEWQCHIHRGTRYVDTLNRNTSLKHDLLNMGVDDTVYDTAFQQFYTPERLQQFLQDTKDFLSSRNHLNEKFVTYLSSMERLLRRENSVLARKYHNLVKEIFPQSDRDFVINAHAQLLPPQP